MNSVPETLSPADTSLQVKVGKLINFGAARGHLKLLDPDSTEFTFQVFDDDKSRYDTSLAEHRHGALDEHKAWLERKAEMGCGIFVMINEGNGQGRKIENIARIRAVWQDDDDGFMGSYPIAPSFVVQSSPGKFQRYWLVDGLTKEEHKGVMARMVSDYGADKNAKDLPRVFRLAGSLHQKDPDNVFRVRGVEVNRQLPYSRQEILEAFPPINDPKQLLSSRAGVKVKEPSINDTLCVPPDANGPFSISQNKTALKSAINAMNPDDEDDWRWVLKINRGAEELLRASTEDLDWLWAISMDWSRKSDKFVDEDQQSKKMGQQTAVDPRAIFGQARDRYGWKNPGTDNTRTLPTAKASNNPERTAIFNEAQLVAPADWTSDLKKDFAKRLGMNVGDFVVALRQCRKSVSIEGELVDGDPKDDGRKSATLTNIIKALGDPQICNLLIAFDEFLGTEVKSNVESRDWQPWTDEDSILMREYLSLNGYKEVSAEIMRDALCGAATKNRIDSAQIWAESLPAWDRTPRCASFFIDHFGVEDSDYAKAVGEYTWSALAGRIMVPGIKADMVPALYGAQGQRKSSGIAAMAPSRELFVEISFHDQEDDIKRKMEGRLVAELAELAGLVKRDQEWLKQFIVCQVDERRPAYKERIRKYPRRLLFIATTNKPQFLSDTTGNRRWLPLPTGQVNVDGIKENLEQLWAEAFVLFDLNGVMFERAETLAQTKLDDHTEESTDSDMIDRWLDTEREEGPCSPKKRMGLWRDQPYISTNDIAIGAFSVFKADVHKVKWRIGDAMRLLGWVSKKQRHGVGKEPFSAWIKIKGSSTNP